MARTAWDEKDEKCNALLGSGSSMQKGRTNKRRNTGHAGTDKTLGLHTKFIMYKATTKNLHTGSSMCKFTTTGFDCRAMFPWCRQGRLPFGPCHENAAAQTGNSPAPRRFDEMRECR